MIQIYWPGLEQPERDAALLLSQNLSTLETHVSQFKDALSLADYCDATRAPHRANDDFNSPDWGRSLEINRQFIQWKMLAIRDGAITIYNFAECKQALSKLIGRCPSLKDKLDRDAFSEAGRIFEGAFPDYAHVRLDVAHSGKLFNAPEKRDQHTVPGTKTIIRGGVTDRTMQSSVNGKMASYSLTGDSLAALEAARDAIYRAYAPVAKFTDGLPMAADLQEQRKQWLRDRDQTTRQ